MPGLVLSLTGHPPLAHPRNGNHSSRVTCATTCRSMYFNTVRAVSSLFSSSHRPSPMMRPTLAFAAAAAFSSFQTGQALRILLNNDDGWASANIRETYRQLREAGHEVLLVAPVVDNSGQGGRVCFPSSSVHVSCSCKISQSSPRRAP